MVAAAIESVNGSGDRTGRSQRHGFRGDGLHGVDHPTAGIQRTIKSSARQTKMQRAQIKSSKEEERSNRSVKKRAREF